jgi:hypothetical protein
VLLLLPGINAFPYPSATAAYSDITITHYPNAVFLRDSIVEYGQIPLWSPTILSGYPFFANPLSGLWYPLSWLALVLPLPFGFNLLTIVHLLIGGLGMYFFLRTLDRSHFAALFGALAFEAMPKIFAHYGAGHLTMVYAISLTPWLLLAEARSWKSYGIFWLRQPGLVLALIALADPRWALYAGALWLAFSMAEGNQSWKSKFIWIGKHGLIAVALSAPLLLPLIEYSQLSTRANMQLADVLAFSLPPEGLLGILTAPFGAVHEWVAYPGIVVLMLAIGTALSPKKSMLDYLWIGVALFSLAFSSGQNLPWFEIIARLPGFSLLRVPPRIMPLASLPLIILATGAFQTFLQVNSDLNSRRRFNLVLAVIVFLLTALCLVIWFSTNRFPFGIGFSLIVLLSFIVLLGTHKRKWIADSFLLIGVLVLSSLDLGVADAALFFPRNEQPVRAEGASVADFLAKLSGRYRVYSPSYSIPQQTAADYRLELADGVDPLQLQSYVDYMEIATGIKNDAYSITLPPFASSNPATDNDDSIPNLKSLALLNVGYIASEFEIDLDGLELAEKIGHTYLFRIGEARPRAYIEDKVSDVEITLWSPNRIELSAQGPGRLVLSEVMYPGWVARIDGTTLEILPYEGILRSVNLSAGNHEVVFEFRPASLYIGFSLFVITSASLCWTYGQEKRRGAA